MLTHCKKEGFQKKKKQTKNKKKNQSSEVKENLHSDKSLETLDHIVSMPFKNKWHPSKKLESYAFELKNVSMTSVPKDTPNHITCRTKEKSFFILEKSSKGILIDACSLHVLGFKTLPKDQYLNVLS